MLVCIIFPWVILLFVAFHFLPQKEKLLLLIYILLFISFPPKLGWGSLA